eukprot:TRINITY_DN30006_c0_g2_i1.p1 TRINITY_DN30006_c0_g2~~TRINITY_DN30006_c0_g2_i1.p1  ORF type:complete len:500 (+),score=130.33 TRINITY_DN30006_c0_g2_i1:94-1593(+)
MDKNQYLYRMLFGGIAAAGAGVVAWRCCARRQRDPPATGQEEEAAAAAGAPPHEQEQECAPAAEPAPSDVAPAPAPAAARPSGSAGAAPAAGPVSAALPFRSARAWRAKRTGHAEACPDDFVSEQQLQEERAAADDVSFVAPGLFLSSYQGAGAKTKLKDAGVTAILCLDSELRPKHPGEFVYKSLDLQDDVYSNLLARVSEGLEFIQEAKQTGGGCLVHCEKGKSRSATMVLAWLMICGRRDLRRAWAEAHAARDIISPNRFFKRQLLRLQQMAQAGGGHFEQHPLYEFHQSECELISRKSAAEVQNELQLSVDPAEYAEELQSGGVSAQSLPGLVCAECGRVVACPLNLLWVGGVLWHGPGTDTATSSDEKAPGDAIIELVYGSLPTVSDPECAEGAAPSPSHEAESAVRCPGCSSTIGSRHSTTAALACANVREPDSGRWQSAAGALAAGAPAELLPLWCAVVYRGRTRIAPVVPLPSESHACPELRAAAAAMRQE